MQRLAAIPPGLMMVPVCVIGFNIWRGQPYPDAHAINAAGVMAIVLALSAFRMAPREVVSVALLCLLGACAATLATSAGETSNAARIFIGGLMLVAAWTATAHAVDSFDKALAFGLWSEVVAWALGNSARGTFGLDIAHSAIGQAYGPWAQPAQLVIIAMAYAIAFTWRRAGPT